MPRKLSPSCLWISSDDNDFEHHGAAVLLLIRNKIAKDWKGLCHTLGLDREGRDFHSGHLGLRATLDKLIDSGLIESRDKIFGPYHITDQALAVIHAMGLSLTQAANLPYFSGLAVRPTYGKPTRKEKSAHAFVIMPFRPELRPVFDGPVKKACQALRFSIERADDIFSPKALLDDILAAISGAYVIIADCTDKNPNVFYELGIAHTLGKPVIMITQREGDVPSDVRFLRYILYTPTRSGFVKLERSLRKTLWEISKNIWAAEKGGGGRMPKGRDGFSHPSLHYGKI